MTRLHHRRVSMARSNKSSSSASVGNNGSTRPTAQTKKPRTPRTRTSAGLRLEEIDRPLIVPVGMAWERHPYSARDPSTVLGALVRQMYPPPIGPKIDQKPVLCWEDYKWSPGPEWRFKCDPSEQEKADGVLEENLTRKVKLMLHEEKAAAIKRLKKKGQLPTELTEEDEDGNRWPTKEALISAKRVDFGTDVGWRLLCEHWSILNLRKLKTGKDPGIFGAWLHTHKLHRGTDEEQICSQRTADHWEDFDKAMKNAHGENWEEEHPDLDGQIIYEAAGRMPHGRLGIANELFSKAEKAKFKSKRAMASQPVQSPKEERLEREHKHLKQEIKRLRGIELVVQSLAEEGGVDFDGIMQSAADDLSPSYSEGGFQRGQGDVPQHQTEKGMGSRTGGSTSHGNDDEDDYYGNGGYDNYGEGDLYGDEHYDHYGDGEYDDYGDEDDYGSGYGGGDGDDDDWL
ncbi:hypothetical protein CFC21_093359 [Triticum aestivum]|uniref:Uncharacterized protein n=2 Tax=Triticum aestivum TaxID=4565 RepID=A0A9R1LKQ0_WHEAT|nr:hypothetical protein CFC21_093359 [Triticum aestivum]